MPKLSKAAREAIAANLRLCRKKKFPGRGGARECAEAYGVSSQQWSPWERGLRVPDQLNLEKLADFFGVTVQFLKTPPKPPGMSYDELMARNEAKGGYENLPQGGPLYGEFRPGSLESFYWLGERLIAALQTKGVKVTIDPQSIAYFHELLEGRKDG